MKLDKTQRSKQRSKIYVGRSTTVHNLLFCVLTLCMNYVTKTFLLGISSASSKQLLCFVNSQGNKREQKHTTKNFSSFITCPPIKCSRDFVYLLLKRYISKWQLAVASTGLVEVQKIKACSRTYAALIIREDCLKLSFNLFCIHLILSSTSGQPIILLELYFSPKRQVRMIHESFCVF